MRNSFSDRYLWKGQRLVLFEWKDVCFRYFSLTEWSDWCFRFCFRIEWVDLCFRFKWGICVSDYVSELNGQICVSDSVSELNGWICVSDLYWRFVFQIVFQVKNTFFWCRELAICGYIYWGDFGSIRHHPHFLLPCFSGPLALYSSMASSVLELCPLLLFFVVTLSFC
jgi:hypothetical protein